MSPAPCRDVALADWVPSLRAAREDGFDFFDWLSAVDQSDDAEAPGFDVLCHLMDSTSGAGSLRRLLVRTRVDEVSVFGTREPAIDFRWVRHPRD